MTVSVSWLGNGRQFNANIANDTVTVIKYSGAGGTPSAAAADGALEGTDALTVTVNKTGIAMFVTLPTALNFNTTESGELVYVWGSFLAAAILANQSANGFGICMSSGTPTTSNYSLWSFYGADNYSGGWKRMILDPTKTRSGGAGTFNPANVTHIGVFADVGGTTARFDNLLLDACDVGTGLKVTGTSTIGLLDELLADELTNRYGVIQALNDPKNAFSIGGQLVLGDDTGVLASSIVDEDSKIFVEQPEYYNAAIVPAVPLAYSGLSIVGNATGDTDVAFGQAVGTEQGRNGISIVGNATYDFSIDRDDGAVESADMYGCTYENITGTINLDNVHDYNSATMVGCGAVSLASTATIKGLTSVTSGQINLNSGGKIIDSLIINNTAASSVLTDDLADVTGNDFTSDGSNHAVELTSLGGGSMSWDNKLSGYVSGGTGGSPVTPTSTGNEAIYVNVGSGTITINVAQGATVPSIRSAGATVNVVAGQRTFSFTVSPSITGYEWRLYIDSGVSGELGTTELAGQETATQDNQSYAYTYSVDTNIILQIISDGYEEVNYYDTLEDSNKSVTINLTAEENA